MLVVDCHFGEMVNHSPSAKRLCSVSTNANCLHRKVG